MPALVTNNFRIHNAKQFREMLSEASLYGGATASTALSTNAYLFIGKSSAWSGSFSDTSIPDPSTATNPSSDTTANTSYSHWKDMIAAKKVSSSDISHVVTRHNWTSGRVYQMFKDTGTQFLGLYMGDHSKCAINTSFNTGTTVGVFCNIDGFIVKLYYPLLRLKEY